MKQISILCAFCLLAFAVHTVLAQDKPVPRPTQDMKESIAQERQQEQTRRIMRQNQFAGRADYPQTADSSRNHSASTPTDLNYRNVEYQLFRGDTLKIGDVAVRWVFTPEDKATSFSLGMLRFTLGNKSAEFRLRSDELIQNREVRYYFAPVGFLIRPGDTEMNGYIRNLEITTTIQPDRVVLSGAPETFMLFISRECPVTVQHERWSISEKPKIYPDGKSIYQLEIRDQAGKLESELPLIDRSYNPFERYLISVEQFNPETMTVLLNIKAEPDPSIQGRWAYRELGLDGLQPLGKIMDQLSETAGIKVDWEPFPGHPESVEYIKTSASSVAWRQSYQTVDKYLESLANSMKVFNYEWISDTELKVTPRDYEKVVAEQKNKIDAERQKQDTKKKFETDYKPEMRLYRLLHINPTTVKDLIEPELKTYALAPTKDDQLEILVVTEGAKGWPNNPDVTLAKETAVADDQSKSLVVTAIPATQEKVARLIQAVDNELQPAPAKVPDRFQIEAILLRGDTAGTSSLPAYLSAKDLQGLGIKSVTQTGRAVLSLAAEKGDIGNAKATLGDGYSVELAFQDLRKPYLVLRGSLTGAVGAAPAANDQVITLDVGNQRSVTDASGRNHLAITLEQVIEALDRDKNGDAAEIRVGTKSLKINELETQPVQIYGVEITAESIEAEPGPHNGRARLRVHFVPESGSSQPQETVTSTPLIENTVFLEPGKPALLGLTNMREALILVLRWDEKK